MYMVSSKKPRRVFVASAWPYANGPLHLGHAASLIGADVLARYHRLKGDQVLFVSGSDCYGTPITLEALGRGVDPSTIAEQYHTEFCASFDALSFSFDLYTKTTTSEHQKTVQDIFSTLHKKGLVYTKVDKALYSPALQRFLPDRFVEGVCPHCGYTDARGDQCDECGKLLDPLSLRDPRVNPKMFPGQVPSSDFALEVRESEHFYLKLSAFQGDLENHLAATGGGWRVQARRFTEGFLQQGLHDRAITRDTDWGVPIPVDGYADKRLYVWFEAVLGYLSAAQHYTQREGDVDGWKQWFFSDDVVHYYVHGKDNVPFHSIILPAILMGAGDYHLPDRIFSSEYLLLEGKQFSTSRGHAVWVSDFLKHFDSELLRYAMIAQGPETSDVDFRWVAFGQMVNGELIGTFGNLVNRICAFTRKNFPDGVSFSGAVGDSAKQLLIATEKAFSSVGTHIEAGEFRQGFREILRVAEVANRFAHTQEPWKHLDDMQRVHTDVSVLLHTISMLSLLIQPFLPKTSTAIQGFFGPDTVGSDAGVSHTPLGWRYFELPKTFVLRDVVPLFAKVEDAAIQAQLEQLGVV